MSSVNSSAAESKLFETLKQDSNVVGVLQMDLSGKVLQASGDLNNNSEMHAFTMHDILLNIRGVMESEPSESPEKLVRVVSK